MNEICEVVFVFGEMLTNLTLKPNYISYVWTRVYSLIHNIKYGCIRLSGKED